MIVYLLKSILCLLALLLIHRLLLQREVLHRFNRFFLLAAVVGSFLIPLYTIEVPVEKTEPVVFQAVAVEGNEVFEQENFSAMEEAEIAEANVDDASAEVPGSATSFPWEKTLWMAYFAVSATFLFRFLRNLRGLLRQIRSNPKLPYRGETLVLHPESHSPFSFLKYIFVSRRSFEVEGISDAVFAHERCHVRERHSWDVLLVEALLVPFWFHPGLYLARHAIRLNHEFIADQAALGTTSVKDYQDQLLSFLLDRPSQSMISSLNFSLTKKRMQMMKNNSGSPFKWLKLVVLVPLIGALVYFFGEKVEVQPEEEVAVDTPSMVEETPIETPEIDIRLLTDWEVEVDGKVIYVDQLAQLLEETKKDNSLVRFSAHPRLKMGVVADIREMLGEKELRKVVFEEWRKYVPNPKWEEEQEAHYKNAYILVEGENMEYTHKAYQLLSERQKEQLSILGKPTFGKKTPHPMIFEDWKNKGQYALWLDEKVISNEELTKMQPSDIVIFWSSSVLENARSARFPQPFQVHLYTEEYYEKELGPDSESRNPLTTQDTITITHRRVTWNKDIQNYPDPNTAYLQKNARYENLRTSGTIYSQKSPEEKALLDKLYQELDSEYSQSSDKRKRSLKEPILPNSNTRRNGDPAQSSSEKIGARTAHSTGAPEWTYSLVSRAESQSKALTDYLQRYGSYQTKANQSSFGAQKSNGELEALLAEYREFRDLYAALSFAERRMVKRPTFPYARMEKDGKVIFKHLDQLTAEERKELGC